jgi:hypothetical protein
MSLSLSDQQISAALPALVRHLPRYLWLQEQARGLHQIQKDKAFRTEFGAFYKFRTRDDAWRDTYFILMDELRGGSLDFPDCLTRLYRATNRVEASFTSELLATLNPDLPVIDSVVSRHAGLKLQYWGSPEKRMSVACEVYSETKQRMNEFLHSTSGQRLPIAFRNYSVDSRRPRSLTSKSSIFSFGKVAR